MKRLICLILTFCLFSISLIVASADTAINTDNSKKHIDEIYFLLKSENLNEEEKDYYLNLYSIIYEHSSVDELSPNYVCVFAGFDFGPTLSYGVFGDYIVRSGNCYFPYEMGYYFYIPAENQIYTLREAWVNKFPEVEKLFTEYGIGELIGDVNGDDKLSIQDATEIQKYISKIISSYDIEDDVMGIRESKSEELTFISDFNRDGERNIKDATAIQKHIAGLEY